MRDRLVMNGCNYRVTAVMRDVLAAIVNAERPAWGLAICEATGLGPAAVYPVLERLMKANVIRAEWENPAPAGRARRRFYHPVYDPGWYRANGLLPHMDASEDPVE